MFMDVATMHGESPNHAYANEIHISSRLSHCQAQSNVNAAGYSSNKQAVRKNRPKAIISQCRRMEMVNYQNQYAQFVGVQSRENR